MTDTQEKTVQELRLSTAKDFLAAVRATDMGVRLATLSAISENPDKALAFGAVDGKDLIDELIVILAVEQPSLIRLAAAAALFSLNDQRSLEQACRMFHTETDLEIMLMAGHRIARETNLIVLEYLLPFLNESAGLQRQRIAARMLAGRDGLQPKQQMQVAFLAGESGAQPPQLTPATLPIWFEALQGEFQAEARGFLMHQGKESFCALKEHWDDLDHATKAWLILWGASHFSEHTVDLIISALSGGDCALQQAAFEAILEYESIDIFQAVLDTITLDGRDTSWIAAAIRAGVPVADGHYLIFSEIDLDVRIALIYSLAKKAGATEDLVRLLKHEDWRIRAAATDALVLRGDRSIEAVAALLNHENMALRTAASQVLIRLGRGDLTQVLTA